MLDKLAQIEMRYEELTNELSSADLLSDPSAYGKAAKQHRSLEEIVEKYRALKSSQEELAGARDLSENAADEEMRELARLEVEALQARAQDAHRFLAILNLRFLVLHRDDDVRRQVRDAHR